MESSLAHATYAANPRFAIRGDYKKQVHVGATWPAMDKVGSQSLLLRDSDRDYWLRFLMIHMF